MDKPSPFITSSGEFFVDPQTTVLQTRLCMPSHVKLEKIANAAENISAFSSSYYNHFLQVTTESGEIVDFQK